MATVQDFSIKHQITTRSRSIKCNTKIFQPNRDLINKLIRDTKTLRLQVMAYEFIGLMKSKATNLIYVKLNFQIKMTPIFYIFSFLL